MSGIYKWVAGNGLDRSAMPCDNCGTNYTNQIPKDCRFQGHSGDYCCLDCASDAEPDVDFKEQMI